MNLTTVLTGVTRREVRAGKEIIATTNLSIEVERVDDAEQPDGILLVTIPARTWAFAETVHADRRKSAIEMKRKPAHGADEDFQDPTSAVTSEMILAMLVNQTWHAFTDGKLSDFGVDVGEILQAKNNNNSRRALLTHPGNNPNHAFVLILGGKNAKSSAEMGLENYNLRVMGWLPGIEAMVNYGDHFFQNRPCCLRKTRDLRSAKTIPGLRTEVKNLFK